MTSTTASSNGSSSIGWTSLQFKSQGKILLDYVADNFKGINEQVPQPDEQPGLLRELLPDEAPEEPDTFEHVIEDFNNIIMKRVTHTSSPDFHADFPFAACKVSALVQLLERAFANLPSKWDVSPSGTELEMLVMDWFAKCFGFPEHFLHGEKGGGVIQTSSSESILLMIFAARNKKIKEYCNGTGAYEIMSKLIVYTSDESHFTVEKSCLFAMIRCHKVPVNECQEMTGEALKQAIETDKHNGLIPFFVVATLGSTSSCAFDRLHEIGPLCASHGVWLHIDAAYAGSAFICPEFRRYLQGVEYADSIGINFYKWMLGDMGCAGLWVKDHSYLTKEFAVDAPYITKDHSLTNFFEWQIHSTRKFNALKMWFVMRLYGIKGLQHNIQKQVALARMAAETLEADPRFEITNKVILGLVCFKLQGKTERVNRCYLDALHADGRVFILGSYNKQAFFLRFCIHDEDSTEDDVKTSVKVLSEVADSILI